MHPSMFMSHYLVNFHFNPHRYESFNIQLSKHKQATTWKFSAEYNSRLESDAAAEQEVHSPTWPHSFAAARKRSPCA
jgi:hypothetical protein